MDSPQVPAIAPRPDSPILDNGKTWSRLTAEFQAVIDNPKPANENAQQQLQKHGFRDAVVRDRVHRGRDAFIASIQDDELCRLASRYHNGDPCTIFTPPVRGSYKICYFVQFAQGDRWVVRVPLAPTLGITPADKLESEVAVMQLIAANTTIPAPKIHAYALGDGPAPFPSFLVLGWHLEGVAPFDIMESYFNHSGGPLCSANDYTAMLLEIAENAFARGRGIVEDEAQAQDRLYHLHIFREYAQKWVDPSLNSGPFVLVHGDLELFNLIFDDDMNIISVLDWEWSRVVPVQFFKPPLWLNSTPFESLCYSVQYRWNLEHLQKFLDILRSREQEKYGEEALADEWENGKQNGDFLVAHALEGWTGMDWFANRYINYKVYRGKEYLQERVSAFIQADLAREALAKQKALAWGPYKAELEELGLDSPSASYTDQQAATVATAKKGAV